MKLTKEEKLESLLYSAERLTEELKYERIAVERTRKRLEVLNKKIQELQSTEGQTQ